MFNGVLLHASARLFARSPARIAGPTCRQSCFGFGRSTRQVVHPLCRRRRRAQHLHPQRRWRRRWHATNMHNLRLVRGGLPPNDHASSDWWLRRSCHCHRCDRCNRYRPIVAFPLKSRPGSVQGCTPTTGQVSSRLIYLHITTTRLPLTPHATTPSQTHTSSIKLVGICSCTYSNTPPLICQLTETTSPYVATQNGEREHTRSGHDSNT